jgi:hypothetical protein
MLKELLRKELLRRDLRVPPVQFPEAFGRAIAPLSVRTRNVLFNAAVRDLDVFLGLTYADVLKLRNCGKKTADEILALQAVLRPAPQAAPCHPDPPISYAGAPSEGFLADAAAPAPWLTSWVRELASTDRHARVFRLRMGMLGAAPVTLDAVARGLGGVTRERVRQMQVKVERKAAASYQQRRLRPLVAEAARVVAENGGQMGLADLIEAVLCRGPDGEQLRHATGLMVFFAGLQVWADAGLQPPRNGIVCDRTRESDALPA